MEIGTQALTGCGILFVVFLIVGIIISRDKYLG